ncbi:hypothetical protein J2W32_003878 [Variovorax boronicumulans]|uniref:Uncharacterized protein n=1 Tax=Variovorax boronicumulans TaxID=436515 RepID=A0AAW8D6I4_9BURK|nr:hypothetical protein [Variovorax boronicumulans]MDQ0054820.1 hypothetical protein [Variovorax boronicumulans]
MPATRLLNRSQKPLPTESASTAELPATPVSFRRAGAGTDHARIINDSFEEKLRFPAVGTFIQSHSGQQAHPHPSMCPHQSACITRAAKKNLEHGRRLIIEGRSPSHRNPVARFNFLGIILLLPIVRSNRYCAREVTRITIQVRLINWLNEQRPDAFPTCSNNSFSCLISTDRAAAMPPAAERPR